MLEPEIRSVFDAGDHDRAATLFVRHCGGDILAFLVGRLKSEQDGSEVFAIFAEDFWRGLPSFQWRSSMRSWAYTLARNAANRYRRSPHNQLRRNLPFHTDSHFIDELAKIRSATKMHLRTEVKSRMRDLREQLPEDDQILLILRVDKGMSWNELAVVLSGNGEDLSDEETVRWAARLRQRFQVVKKRLRELAIEEGLFEDGSGVSPAAR